MYGPGSGANGEVIVISGSARSAGAAGGCDPMQFEQILLSDALGP